MAVADMVVEWGWRCSRRVAKRNWNIMVFACSEKKAIWMN